MSGLRAALARAAGPGAFSWPAFWAVLAVSVFLHLSEALRGFTPREAALRAVAMTVAVAAMFGAMALLRRPLLGDPAGRRRPVGALVLFALGAVVRGAVLSALLVLLLGVEPNVPYRIAAAVMSMVPLLVVVAALVDAARAEAVGRAELAAAELRLAEAEERADEQIAAAHAATVARIRDVLEQAVGDGAASADVAARLRREVDAVIRPLSHELAGVVPQWLPSPRFAVAPAVRWRALWRDMTLGQPFQPGAMALLALVIGFISFVNRAGVATGTASTALLAFTCFVALATARAAVGPLLRRVRSSTARLGLFAGSLLVVFALAAAVVGAAFEAAGRDPRPSMLQVLVLGLLVATLLACLQAVFAGLRAVEADLGAATAALDIALARVNAVAWQRQRVLALAIHGPLQARIAAAALRIEQAAAASVDVDRAIAEARESILQAVRDIDEQVAEQGDVRGDLRDIAEAWEGVCDVGVDLDVALAARIDADPACARVVVDVCTEACSNAVRHANATAVAIAVAGDGRDLLRIDVRSDGTPRDAGPEGLGTRLLDEVAVRWDRRLEDRRTVLEVLLPAPSA